MEQDEETVIREAMRIIGRRTSERKKQSSADNGKKGGRPVGTPQSEEAKARIREGKRLRRERELSAQPVAVANDAQKRGRGRPRKAEQATLPLETPQAGA